jgi:predicted GH43/DUF377 family glycosyl hydrolase
MNIDSIAYFIVSLGIGLALFAAVIAFVFRVAKEVVKYFSLSKHVSNPVMSPPEYADWEAIGTFNPAAVLDDRGNVHIVYRALGADGMSRFGYAKSSDAINFKDKSPYPIFVMQSPRKPGEKDCLQKFDPNLYPSGGSWGGCEDPRMVRIGGRVYITFNAFDGWDYIRMAVSSIDENDFFNKKWKWSEPKLISPPGQINKNWVLFPEKINGKFAILHSISPNLQIDYIDELNDLTYGKHTIKSRFGQKQRREGWDSWLRGVGPPPIKTERGWLVLYHATTQGEGCYKLGAMLLDLNDPKKIIGRSQNPILVPEHWYESDWKPGVVYACGAVIRDGDLFVYYGGGDKHICVAHTPLEDLLNSLVPN